MLGGEEELWLVVDDMVPAWSSGRKVGRSVASGKNDEDSQLTNQIVNGLGEWPEMEVVERLRVADGEVEDPHPMSAVKVTDGFLDQDVRWCVRRKPRRAVWTRGVGFKYANDPDTPDSREGQGIPELFVQGGEENAPDYFRAMRPSLLPLVGRRR